MRKTLRQMFLFLMLSCMLTALSQPAETSEVEDMFWSRQWTSLENKLRSPDYEASARDRVMYANSLWLRGEMGAGSGDLPGGEGLPARKTPTLCRYAYCPGF